MRGRQAMKDYRAIFIDWDDTIGDFHYAERCALTDIYGKYSLQRLYSSFEDYYFVYHPYNLHLWEMYGMSRITKEELEFQRFCYPIQALPDAESIAPLIAKDFLRLTTEYFTLLPYAEEVVRYLAGKYPLTVVSNGFVEVQYKKIARSGLKDCFKYVVLSEEVGVQKPNPAIYEHALQLNGLQASDVLMIGDSWSSDIQGAINAGIDQMWITNDVEDLRPSTYRVNDLRQLLDLL